ncbi:uncharacterized protein UV8b_03010 [Ustilaginoidea virens]|uniref:Helicase C-terminal domain-containing protein n=1 Tax=Ustilaginoidea virens TaxID=1159556 RepID=A0A8E5HNJ6_USTVR|nr:uncharacterized protein UV8b_03010 [Ustilaginoidea virens]QUC18769.1 hypothetical protein UV8b_03010 [Ustilaginoidea virens]
MMTSSKLSHLGQVYVPRQDYIPIGCLGIPHHDTEICQEDWEADALKTWKRFASKQLLVDQCATKAEADREFLSPEFQSRIFDSKALKFARRLFEFGWIDLEFCADPGGASGIVRVHVLPDDAQHEVAERAMHGLEKARKRLLRLLDYSRSTWEGTSTALIGKNSPFAPKDGAGEQDYTLLQVFNTIPSPVPDQSLVSKALFRDAMNDLLHGAITGLTTDLLPYQRRSTAAMLQKESDPGVVLDPRLLTMESQDGSTYFMDPVVGTVLREPRYCDNVAGGILAEEMGSGKTIICLALILATRNLPTYPPEMFRVKSRPRRREIGTLADMAASCVTRNDLPWRLYFETWRRELGYDFARCEQAIRRNPGYYLQPRPNLRRRKLRYSSFEEPPPVKMFLSNATLIVVPNNLVSQWRQEMAKHTSGLKVCILAKYDDLPPRKDLLDLDILLFSQSCFECLAYLLTSVHFKRCIVDEGHKLGNSKISRKSNLLIELDSLTFSSKWIVTGTPSHGLYGVDDLALDKLPSLNAAESRIRPDSQPRRATAEMEKRDLERLGSIMSLYLKARPWANCTTEHGDGGASWAAYMLLPRHSKNSHGSWDCLKATLNSLIIRHRLSEIGNLLPPVDEKVVVLDGSYQDRLSLNLFAMMIIFNSVQSQRTDVDYFFHPRQRKSLLEIVHNLKQSSFFGASFFTSEEIAKSVGTAEAFLAEGKVPISAEDRALLCQAIKLGRVAVRDKLRNLSNRFHEMPLLVRGPLGSASHAWSLDGEGGDSICTSASLLLSLQRLLASASHEAERLNSLLNGGLIHEGLLERDKMLAAQESPAAAKKTAAKKKELLLAGNTKLGSDTRRPQSRTHGPHGLEPMDGLFIDGLPASLRRAKVASTVSAKLSYLIDGVLHHQKDEKIIIFYENENVAWYLASMLDVLLVQHLIYAKSLSTERKAQYVDAFNHNHVFRVLLMDVSQAAFGLDMHEASRIYFINPVLNPQVEAQAIGRARRISQHRAVSVETLVLRDSIDEVILERKQHMTQAEHGQVKSLLDVRPIYNWIKNATILDLPRMEEASMPAHMVDLRPPQPVFARAPDADEGALNSSRGRPTPETAACAQGAEPTVPAKRLHDGGEQPTADGRCGRPRRRIRFARLADSDETTGG